MTTLYNVICLDEICYMLPQTIDRVSPVFVLGILTTETCGHINRGPGSEISVRGSDRTGIRVGHVSGI